MIGWSPLTFWAATPHETLAALEGHALANGAEDTEANESDFAAFKAALGEE